MIVRLDGQLFVRLQFVVVGPVVVAVVHVVVVVEVIVVVIL